MNKIIVGDFMLIKINKLVNKFFFQKIIYEEKNK